MTVQEDDSMYSTPMLFKRSGRVLSDFDLKKQGIWCLGMGIVVIATFVAGYWPVGLFLVLFTTWGTWPFDKGYGYQLPRIWWRGAQRKRKGGIVYTEASAENVGVKQWVTEFFPGGIATVFDAERGTDTAYIEVRGFRSATADPADRYADMHQLAEALKKAISQTIYTIRYGFAVGVGPSRPTLWAQSALNRYQHPDLIAAYESMPAEYADRTFDEWLEAIEKGEPFAVERAQMVNMAQAWQESADTGTTPVYLIRLTVERPASWKTFIRDPHKFTLGDFRRSTHYRVFEALEAGIRHAGYRDTRMLTLREVRPMVFAMHNVLRDSQAEALGQEPGFQGVEWPQTAIEVTHNSVRFDNCHHALLVIKSFGRNGDGPRRIRPDGLDELMFPSSHPPNTLVTTFAETFSARKERWFARQKRDLNLAWFYHRNRREELADREREQTDAEVIDMLHASGSQAIRSNHVVVLRASSLDELEEYVQQEEAFQRSRLGHSVKRFVGRDALPRAFWSAVLGICP